MGKHSRLLTMALLLVAGLCPAEQVRPEARSLAVFKNGLGFVIRSAELTLVDGWGEIGFIPKAALGSFWLFPSMPKAYVEVARAGWRKQRLERECRTLAELLGINTGNRARLHLSVSPSVVEGELLAEAAGDAEEGKTPTLVHVRTSGGNVVTLPLEQIRLVEWLGAFRRKTGEEKASPVLKLKVRDGGSGGALHMAYLTRGISWLPGYWLDIREADRARIVLKATLLNDLEDFRDLDVTFVVGYPNFVFSHLDSPLTLGESVEDFLSRLTGRPQDSGAFANVATQAIGRNAFHVDGMALAEGGDIEAAGQGTEDFFFFSQKNVTLQKGERAEYTIFSSQVPYEHIYECSLNDISGIDEWGNRQQHDRESTTKPSVWHCLKLTNTTPYPWTTGPALVMKSNEPLAQNQLNYLARGAAGLLRLTYAPDIAVQQGEEETGRRDDVVINRNHYTEVQVQGTVSLRSHKKEAVKMEVNKTLSGFVLFASDAGKASRQTDEIRGVNPRTLVRWSLSLAAGETRKLTYKYKVYVD